MRPFSVLSYCKCLFLPLLLLSSVCDLSAQTSAPLTNDSIIQLTAWHFSPEAIISAIHANPTQFDLSPQATSALEASGVAATVLTAMGTPPAPATTSETPDEVFFTDGSIAKGKVLFVQCQPGTGGHDAPAGPMRPAIEFQSADITGKSLLQAPSLLQLTLADGRVSLTGAGTDAASKRCDPISSGSSWSGVATLCRCLAIFREFIENTARDLLGD